MEKVGDFLSKKAEQFLEEDSDDSDFVDALEDLAAESEKTQNTVPTFPGDSGDRTCIAEHVKSESQSTDNCSEDSQKNTHLDCKDKASVDEQSFAAKIVEDVIQSAKRIHISESQEFKKSGQSIGEESEINNPGATEDFNEDSIPEDNDEDKDKSDEEDERLIIDEEALKEREERLTDDEKQVLCIASGIVNQLISLKFGGK